MGLGGVAIVILPSIMCLKLTFSDGLGGGIQKRIYLVEHPQGLYASQNRQRIAQDAGGYIKHPDQKHWMGDRTEEYGNLPNEGFQTAPLLTA